MSTLTLPQTNGAKARATSELWQRESVKSFFTGFNWENHPADLQEIKLSLSENNNTPLTLKMSVCQFFATINWDDTTIAAPSPAPSTQAAPDSLTLDDFSGLF